MNTRMAHKLLLFSLVVFLLSLPRTVFAKETEMTEEILTEIENRLDRAFQTGETQADLSDMDIIVNMYSDRLGTAYQAVLDLCDAYEGDHGCFLLGTHKEPFVDLIPDTEETSETNEYGVGPNRLKSITLYYEDYYRRPDGSPDLDLIAGDRELLAKEYAYALSVVSDEMNDTEKALALYDYVIAVSNYPDTASIDEQGIEVYDNESYSALSVFRDHLSVCIANATAYCYLLSDCGIPCIRVDSDEMLHSWVMLKVDGAWYHADPTWDDPRYMDGLTCRGDYNDDSWDLGASGHSYFLKSDEEMTERLGHYGWTLAVDYTKDGSVTETPASGPSGSFENTFFGSGGLWQEYANYSYVNGSWYVLDWFSNQIVRTSFGQDPAMAERIEAPSENSMKYVCGSGDYLFICEETGIWRFDTRDGKAAKLPLAENTAGPGTPVFTEMNIASGRLNGVVIYTNEAGESVSHAYSYPVEDLLQMEAVTETEEAAATAKASETAEEAAAGKTENGADEKQGTRMPYIMLLLLAAAGLSGSVLYGKGRKRRP